MTVGRGSSIFGHRVVALALPGVVTFDLGCVIQVFARRPELIGGPGHYDFTTCGVTRRVKTSDGFDLSLEAGLDALETAETVVVPGYAFLHFEMPAAARRALAAAAERGSRLMSICVGAFALAEAGLLDGRRATTHWQAASMLAERFPAVEVLPDVLYVDDGEVLTSAGLAAGLDLCLHVVRRDHGSQVAADIARFNLVAPHRDGGQAQFAPRPIAVAPEAGLASTRAWALEHLDESLSLADLAAHACCSERTLTRRFRDETGASPKQWLLQMRLERARELLESTSLPVEHVASAAGFPSASALRQRFGVDLETTPTAYRRAFGSPVKDAQWRFGAAQCRRSEPSRRRL